MKNRVIRYTLNGVILAAIATIGVTAYQIGTSPSEEKIIQEVDDTETEEFAMLEEGMDEDENLEEYFFEDETKYESSDEVSNEIDESSEIGISDIKADFNEEEASVNSGNVKNMDEEIVKESSVDSDLIDIEVPEEDWDTEETSSQSILQQLHFSDMTEIEWPTYGEILLKYNMNQTIYFPTLDQYKLNPAIAVEAEVGTPVLAAASGMVYDIMENVQTGTTVIMELGDGYQAIYGQLKDLTVEEGEMIEQGTVIGYIDAPTKYYSVEGSNLYFSMKRNGEYIDPTEYLPE